MIKKKEDKELKEIEKELKKLDKIDMGSPSPPKVIGFNPQLLYAGQNWCILLDNGGKAYAVWSNEHTIHTKQL